jgi:phage-related holin
VGLPLGQAVAGFYCAHELLSLLENSDRAGLPVPGILRDALKTLSPEVEPKT